VRAAAPSLLVTIDVEIAHDRDLNEQADVIWRLSSELTSFPSTWFCTADAAERFAEPLRALVQAGHTIGCHGRDHGIQEDYRRLSPSCALQTLGEATHRIETALGVRPRVFRGPRMTTSAATHYALRVLGYLADFSVCAWRFDFLAASRFNLRWLAMGSTPYCPASEDPFLSVGRPAAGKLAVVPLSGFGVPLVSGAVYLLGEKLMLFMTQAMSRISSRADAPIVYLFHSYEFVDIAGSIDHRPTHQRLYPGLAVDRYMINLRFLKKLRLNLGLDPISADNYLRVITDVP
jgi:hypothetical protein